MLGTVRLRQRVLGDRSEMSPLPPCQHFKKTAGTTVTPACTLSSQHPLGAAQCLSINPSKISHLPCLPAMAQDKHLGGSSSPAHSRS